MTDKDGDVTLSREPFSAGIRDNEDRHDHELDYKDDLVSIDGDEDDDGGTPIRKDDPETSNADIERIEKRRVHLESSLREHVRDAVRDSLFSDPYIIETVHACGIPEDQIFTQDKRNRLIFYLKASFFADWKARHQISIGTAFTQHGRPYAYTTKVFASSSEAKKERVGQIKTRYDCHRRGVKYMVKGRQPGGKSGKTRLELASNKCGCPSHFNAIYRPLQTRDGIPGETYRIEYNYQHIHALGDKGNIGTQQKSKAMRERIKAMLMGGMSISTIMTQLTMDHAKFTRLMDGAGISSRFARDDSITYEDVYNIYYALTVKRIRRDDNAFISARLWMEELHNRGYFTYYDKVRGLYHGFSSPWQLNEFRKWGDVFCFDGTHHAYG
ncbi:hypothetical protein BGZ54_006525, partial [Gamsiella multidivaricata]